VGDFAFLLNKHNKSAPELNPINDKIAI
jgi:hypothetical protein